MQQKTILVVGGAGFIGSHMVEYLLAHHFKPIVIDNLSTGHRSAVSHAELFIGDIADTQLLDEIFSKHEIFAVMHFASLIQVNESVMQPLRYYQNNVTATVNLLQAMQKWQVKKFIFSSSAAVYGEPQFSPIDEMHPLNPINPYGQSKRMVEKILEDLSDVSDFQFAALRYFNAAGRNPESKLRECHQPETHLIPLVLQAAFDSSRAITVYGRDYPTVDGTCVRDYVHVLDLCAAHLAALRMLERGEKKCIYNLGTGVGYSVQQVIDVASQVTGKKIRVVEGERRLGDPAVLVADARRAIEELGWVPGYSELEKIILHAWDGIRESDSFIAGGVK